MTAGTVMLLLMCFAAGAVFSASVAWFIWIYHERRSLRIQSRMFDEAAKWARQDFQNSARDADQPDTTVVLAFMPVDKALEELRQ